MASSESKLGLPTQPYNTCPDIDSVIESLEGIEEEIEEDGQNFVPDLQSLNSAMDNAEEISLWGKSWLDLTEENIEPLLMDIIFKDNEDIYIEEYSFFNIDNAKYELELIQNAIKDGREYINEALKNCEWTKSDIEQEIEDSNPSALKSLENFRDLVVDLRQICDNYKQIVKPVIFDYMPELAGEKTIYEQKKEKIEKEKMHAFLNKKKEEVSLKANKNFTPKEITNTFHYSRHGDDIEDFSNYNDNVGIFDCLGLHTGNKNAIDDLFKGWGHRGDNGGIVYPLEIKTEKPLLKDDGTVMSENDVYSYLDSIMKDIKKSRGLNPWDNEIKQIVRDLVWSKYDCIPYVNDVEGKGDISFISPAENIKFSLLNRKQNDLKQSNKKKYKNIKI